MELLDVLNHHLKGGQFEYKSYDFKQAKEYFKNTPEGKSISYTIDHFSIPNEMKEKFSCWRIGKIRRVDFFPNGEVMRIYIGAQRAKTFYNSNLDTLRLVFL